MSFEEEYPFEQDFHQNINQFIHLLKKILNKSLPGGLSPQSHLPADHAVNFNVYFFTFLPPLPEEPDVFDRADPDANPADEREEGLSTRLSRADLEFLRAHGIRF